jgi:hypothetical protein
MSHDDLHRKDNGRSLEREGNIAAAEIVRNVESTFPGSKAGIIVVRSHALNPQRHDTIIDQGRTKELMYAASMTKPAWMTGILHVAEDLAKKRKTPVSKLTISLSPEEQKELRTELDTDLERPDISVHNDMSLREMTDLTVGLSANTPLSIMKTWMTTQLHGQQPADFIQQRTEAIVKSALGKNDILLTITGSQKAQQNGTWNCASLEELLTFNRLLADADSRLGLSPESIQLMQQAMTLTADPDIELGHRLQGNTKVKRVLGKSGYWPYTEKDDIAVLPDEFGLGPGKRWLMHLGTVERVERDSGTRYDIGYMAALPNNAEATTDFDEVLSKGAKAEFTGLKKAAAGMMADGIVRLIK